MTEREEDVHAGGAAANAASDSPLGRENQAGLDNVFSVAAVAAAAAASAAADAVVAVGPAVGAVRHVGFDEDPDQMEMQLLPPASLNTEAERRGIVGATDGEEVIIRATAPQRNGDDSAAATATPAARTGTDARVRVRVREGSGSGEGGMVVGTATPPAGGGTGAGAAGAGAATGGAAGGGSGAEVTPRSRLRRTVSERGDRAHRAIRSPDSGNAQ